VDNAAGGGVVGSKGRGRVLLAEGVLSFDLSLDTCWMEVVVKDRSVQTW
jgi:hypothetical protein